MTHALLSSARSRRSTSQPLIRASRKAWAPAAAGTSGLVAVLSASAVLAGAPVTLKHAPIDTDGTVTLAELFEGTNSAAVVSSGPKGAGSVVLDASRVQAAARAAGLSWANPAGVRRIVVRGSAAVAAPAPVASVSAQPGVAQSGATEVLTYARSLNAGAVVTADDLVWAVVARAPQDAPADAEDAIGQAVRKPVRAGTAVSARDLATPRVIAKNDTVSVQYRAGRINLTLQGKALTPAALGETVRILNPGSKTVVEAVAAGPGLAVVGPQAEALKLRGPAALASR